MSDESNQSVPASECSSSNSCEQENQHTAPLNSLQVENNQHQKAAPRSNVFERNYEFARIYENKRRALAAKLEANEKAQRNFKAQPIRIVEKREAPKMPRFTVPTTPKVMKHQSGKRTTKEQH